MDHSLQQRIAAVRNRAGRIVWQSAGFRFMIALLSSLLVAGFVDYGFRIHDRDLQVMLSLLVAGSVLVAAYRFFRPAFRYHLSDVKLARHIEMRYPELGGSLSSSMEFLTHDSDDPRMGSATLRREVIDQAAAQSESIDFSSVVDQGRAQRLKRTLLCLVGVLLILLCLSPSRWTLAARRLLNPLGSPDWPRRHILEFESVPSAIAVGANLDLAVVDRNGQLPETVQLVTMPASETDSDPQLQTVHELILREDRMVGTIENVTRSLKVRALGGDDDRMPWQEIRVVEPPRIRELQFSLHPPDYTGWPIEIAEDGIRALVGTRVEVDGRSDLPIASATLQVRTPEAEQAIVASVGPDRRTFHISADQVPAFVVEASGFFSMAVRDRQEMGLPDDETWEIRAISDIPPTIEWQQPRDGASITRYSNVSLQLTISDDLAVKSVVVEHRRSDRLELGWVPCHTLDLSERPPPQRVHPEGQGESRTLNWQWNVADLEGLTSDVVLEVRAADDYLPQSSTSDVRRIHVVTPALLRSQFDSRQAELLLGLTELLAEQQAAHDRAAQLVRELQVPSSRPRSVAGVRGLESAQRRIRQRLVTDDESLWQKLQQLSDEIRANQLDDGAVGRIRKLTEVLRALDSTSLPAAEEQLFAASQQGADQSTKLEQLVQALLSAQTHQANVLRSLDSSVGDLAGWDKRQRVAGDLEGIIGRQDQLRLETQQIWRATVTRDPPPIQDRPAVDGLIRRQQELTRYLERVAAQMETMRHEIEVTDADTAAALARALDVGQNLRVASHMQRSVDRIREQQLAEATTRQQQATDGLQAMRQVLLPAREPAVSLHSEFRQVSELLRRTQEWAERQQSLVDETERMDQLRDGQRLRSDTYLAPVRELAGRQRALSADVDRLARHTSQPVLYQFALRLVVREMDSATENLLRRQTDEATRRFQQRAHQGLLGIVESLEFAGNRQRQSPIPPTPMWPASWDESAPDPSQQSPDLAMLRLMRRIQADIRERTAQWATVPRDDRLLTDAERQELDQLSRDQADLAQLVSQLTGSAPRRRSPEVP